MLARIALLAAISGPALVAQSPQIYTRGIVNAGSYAPAGLANGAIAQGSIFTIFGEALGPAAGVSAGAYPLGAALSGVTITVSQGTTQVNAIPVFVFAFQINALMPSNAPTGMVSVRVIYNNARSNPAPVRVAPSAFGFFTANGTGGGPGVFQNATAGALPVNTNQTPAMPGQLVNAYGTGLGPITAPDNQAPPAGNVSTKAEIWVGGKQAQITYQGRSPCCSGLDQIQFRVPDDAPPGCWVPVYVRTAGTTMSNATTLAISADGSPCSEPQNPLAAKYISGGRIGSLRLIRNETRHDFGQDTPATVTADFFTYGVVQVKGGPFVWGSLFSQPPAGSCTIFSGAGDYFLTGAAPFASVVDHWLDTGPPFRLTGPAGTRTLTLPDSTSPLVPLGSFAPPFANQLVLTPGQYTLTGTGGAEAGAFQVPVTLPAPFTWTGRDQLSSVDRTKPLALSWTGLPAGQTMVAIGGNSDLPTNSFAAFYCVAPAGAASLTVPPEVLSAIPASRANPLQSKGVIYLTNQSLSNGVSFSLPGVDAAVAIGGAMSGRTVTFQ